MDTQHLFDIFLNWVPMLVLIGVWVFFMQKMRTPGGKSQLELVEENVIEQKRFNGILEKLLTEHSTRLDQLEKAVKAKDSH